MRITIKEVIVVEGRDDESAVKAAADAEIIVTRGYKISEKTWELLAKADAGPGLLILTDPDHAGDQIRSRLAKRFPNAKHAYLPKAESIKNGDIGIENASPENIASALEKAHYTQYSSGNQVREELFTGEDLQNFGLIGEEQSGQRRDQLGKSLGIGYGNAKTFLSRLNHYGITKEEYYTHGKALFTDNDQSGNS
jgi:ribonuclease M5